MDPPDYRTWKSTRLFKFGEFGKSRIAQDYINRGSDEWRESINTGIRGGLGRVRNKARVVENNLKYVAILEKIETLRAFKEAPVFRVLILYVRETVAN
jgi:hypothetical protein